MKITTILAIVMAVVFMLALVACTPEQTTPTTPTTPTTDDTQSATDILVVYFSATNTTEGVAQLIAEVTDGDIWEIVPQVPYTSADLNYNNENCRANQEQNDSSARPAIVGSVDVSLYDVVFVGYPIWWGDLPKIMYTFFEAYDFDGKTVVPFCTSGGSGISASVNEIERLEPDATILNGQRFSGSASKSAIESWVNGLNLPQPSAMMMTVTCGDIEIICRLNDSVAAKALYAQLPLTVDIRQYSDNEMIFYPTSSLDVSDAPLAEGGVGTLAYYEPWGNVVLFYGDFDKNSSLFALGEVVSGAENIRNLSDTITVSVAD